MSSKLSLLLFLLFLLFNVLAAARHNHQRWGIQHPRVAAATAATAPPPPPTKPSRNGTYVLPSPHAEVNVGSGPSTTISTATADDGTRASVHHAWRVMVSVTAALCGILLAITVAFITARCVHKFRVGGFAWPAWCGGGGGGEEVERDLDQERRGDFEGLEELRVLASRHWVGGDGGGVR